MPNKLIDKRLVRKLMDVKKIDAITITKDKIAITVNPKFTPEDGNRLIQSIGHTSFLPVTRNGKNYLILDRY